MSQNNQVYLEYVKKNINKVVFKIYNKLNDSWDTIDDLDLINRKNLKIYKVDSDISFDFTSYYIKLIELEDTI